MTSKTSTKRKLQYSTQHSGLGEVLKEEQDRGLCTGSNRDKHWRAPAPGGRDADIDGAAAPVLNGNSANAAGAAASAALKV